VLERRAGEFEGVAVRVGGGADVVPVEHVLPQPVVPAGGLRIEDGLAEAVGGGMRVGEERRVSVAAIARPR
jgi:hypothetical protein